MASKNASQPSPQPRTMMTKLPNELRSMIVRLLSNKADRKALVEAYPEWKPIVEHEESLRSLDFDPEGCFGHNLKDFVDLFKGEAVRRRQFLQEVNVKISLEVNEVGCCAAGHDIDNEEEVFTDGIRDFLQALNDISKRLAEETSLPLTPMRLALLTCDDGVPDQEYCYGEHDKDDEAVLVAKWYHEPMTLLLADNEVPVVKGIDQFYFENDNLLEFLELSFIPLLLKRLVDLRVVHFVFDEQWRKDRERKDEWRDDVTFYVGKIPSILPLEELCLELNRYSPRNEFIAPSRYRLRTAMGDHATKMLQNLSKFASLTVLRLSGQFCIPVDFFDVLASDDTTPTAAAAPFPALKTFELAIGPDTSCGKWFFIKDETEHAYDKAAEDPKWTSYVKHVKEGIFLSDPIPDWEPTSDDEGYYEYMAAKDDEYAFLDIEPVKRNRTLPNDETINPMLRAAARVMGKMAKIEIFRIYLGDNFGADGEEVKPFVPQFMTRKFRVKFVKKPKGKDCPALIWTLGQKIDHWRPADDVLEAWKVAAGGKLEISYVE